MERNMARMSSRKIGRKHGGASAKIMDNTTLCHPYGVVLSGSSLILNFTNDERVYSLILDGVGEVDAVRHLLTQALPAQS